VKRSAIWLGLFLVPLSLFLGRLGGADEEAALAWLEAGPLIGHTSSTSTRIWIKSRKPGALLLEIRKAGGKDWRSISAKVDAADGIAIVVVDGLAPRQDYEYRFTLDGVAAPGAKASFRSLPAPGAKSARIAFGSCAHTARFPEQPIFKAIAKAKPDAFVFLGDSVYLTRSDCKEPRRIFGRYLEGRLRTDRRHMQARIPNYAIWDDHDFGPNNSDKTFKHRGESLRVFKRFWANPSYGSEGRPGIWSRARVGPMELFLTDGRSYRDPNAARDKPSKTMLGKIQRRWLLDALEASTAPLKVVCCGGQFLARYHAFEGYQLYRYERNFLVKEIMRRGVKGVVFLSGDRHLAEVIRWERAEDRYPLYDITSSPLANVPWRRGGELASPRRKLFYGKSHNFGMLSLTGRKLHVSIHDTGGAEVAGLDIDLGELELKDEETRKPL